MSTHTDDNPQSLALAPKPETKRMNSMWFGAGGLAAGILLAVMFYSIFSFDTQTQDEGKNKDQVAQIEHKPLTESPLESGLVAAQVPHTETKTMPTAKAPVLSPQQQAMLQEREQIRQMRMQLQLQAMQAPLAAASTNTQQNRPVNRNTVTSNSASVPQNGSTGTKESPVSQQYDTSDRKDKEAFLQNRSKQDSWRLEHTRIAGAPCEIKTGTVIPGIMLTGINSDLPGKIIGQVSQNVYDTATGNMLIIPQGSRLIGVYDSRVAVGQNRVLIAWNRIIFPDGSSVDIETMPGTDQAGYAGFEDEVNNHYLRIFGSATIMSLIGGGMAYTVDSMGGSSNNQTGNNNTPSLRDEMGTALAAQLGQASLQLLQQNVNIKPTLEIRPGYRFNIVLVKDLVFEAPYKAMR